MAKPLNCVTANCFYAVFPHVFVRCMLIRYSYLLSVPLLSAVIVTALVAASGGLLFGFDNGITGGEQCVDCSLGVMCLA